MDCENHQSACLNQEAERATEDFDCSHELLAGNIGLWQELGPACDATGDSPSPRV